MEKRQRYSVKEAAPSLHNGNFPSWSATGEHSGGEAQCSYMFGGLGDLRREIYFCKSPLKAEESRGKKRQAKAKITISIHFTTLFFSHSTARKNSRSITEEKCCERKVRQKYCDDAATAAAKLKSKMAPSTVKINPLMESYDEGRAERGENPVFYGQRTKIRKTKEQEMISALLEVAQNGI